MSMQSNILNAQPIKVENKQNNGINLFKFLCAILVVGIHTEPFGNLGILDSLFGIITRIAVPYFFVCSSYFYFLKGDAIKKLKHYIKRIFTLYLLWSIVYLAYDLCISDAPIFNILCNFIQDFFLQGYKHFWYLQASVVAIIILVLLDKITKSNAKAIFTISFALLIIGLIFSTYFPLFSKISIIESIDNTWFFEFFGTRNGFFYAPIYMAIGYYYAKGFQGFKIKTSFLMSCCMLIALGVEGIFAVYFIHTNETNLWLSVAPLIFFLFDFSRKLDIKLNLTFLGKCSTVIYCFHPLFILFISDIEINNILKFLFVGIVSFGFSALFYFLQKYKPLNWLKYFQ